MSYCEERPDTNDLGIADRFIKNSVFTKVVMTLQHSEPNKNATYTRASARERSVPKEVSGIPWIILSKDIVAKGSEPSRKQGK